MNPIINQRHETYWNLHKDVFSVRVKGRVVQHIRSAFVRNVTFAVQPAGRAKVLLEQRKNVHAFVRGDRMKHFDGINVSIIKQYCDWLGVNVSCTTPTLQVHLCLAVQEMQSMRQIELALLSEIISQRYMLGT